MFSDSIIEEAIDLIKESNLLILKCYQDLKYLQYYIYNKGSYIILSLIIFQIISTIIFFSNDLFRIKKYIYCLTKDFISYKNQNNNKNNNQFYLLMKNKNKTPRKKNKEIIKIFPLNYNIYKNNNNNTSKKKLLSFKKKKRNLIQTQILK